IATRCHVAPASAAILRVVEEYALASWIGTAAHAGELAQNERVGRRFDDGDDEPGERIADRHERAHERAVGAELDAPCARASTEHAVDLREPFAAHALTRRAAFGEAAERGAHAARIDERRCGAGGLLLCAATDAAGALVVEHRRSFQPPY